MHAFKLVRDGGSPLAEAYVRSTLYFTANHVAYEI